MQIAFFGSPDFSADILKTIHKRFPVSLVVTQPDKPVGRKHILTPTPVKQFALQQSIPIISDTMMIRIIGVVRKEKIDVAIVAAYGLILPKELFEIPKYGFLNIHYSLLPKYRGASPVQWAILNGDKETGVSIILLDEKLDHGPILETNTVDISKDDTAETLLHKLNKEASSSLYFALTDIELGDGLPDLQEQKHDKATMTRRLTKDDGFIECSTIKKAMNGEQLLFSDLPKLQQEIFKSPNTKYYIPNTIHNFIRALHPWPGAWTLLPNGKRLKIICSHIRLDPEFNEKSTFTDVYNKKQKEFLVIDEIQVEGKGKTKDTRAINAILRR